MGWTGQCDKPPAIGTRLSPFRGEIGEGSHWEGQEWLK